MADMADIADVEEAWDALTRAFGDTFVPDHVHELDRGDQGVRRRNGGLVCTSSNAQARVRVGLGAEAAHLLPARRAPGPQHRRRARRRRSSRSACGIRGSTPARRWRRSRARRGSSCGAATARCTSVHARAGGASCAARSRACRSSATPSASTRRARPPTSWARPTSSSRRSRSAPPGLEVGGRHRDPSRQSAGPAAPGQLIISMQQNVCACATMYRIDPVAPVLGAREPGRRPRRQRDQGRRRDDPLGARGARADARGEVGRHGFAPVGGVHGTESATGGTGTS